MSSNRDTHALAEARRGGAHSPFMTWLPMLALLGGGGLLLSALLYGLLRWEDTAMRWLCRRSNDTRDTATNEASLDGGDIVTQDRTIERSVRSRPMRAR